MAETYVQVAPDSTGKQIDAFQPGSYLRQVVVIGDPNTAANVAAVDAVGAITIKGVQDNATTGTITSSSSTVGPLSVTQRNVVTITVRGTYAGVTFTIEATDDGTNWYPLQVINNASGLVGSTWGPFTNTVASFDAAIGGYTQLRVRSTAWTSGTATVGITAQSFAYDPVVGAVMNGVDASAIPRIILLNSTGLQPVTLGNSAGKTNVLKTGNLVTTATTADQVILTYTVTSGKTLYLLGFNVTGRLTTYATTATLFGTVSLENPSGTKLNTAMVAHAGVIFPPYQEEFFEPIPIASGTVIRLVCTPAAATSFTWQGNLWGYEV